MIATRTSAGSLRRRRSACELDFLFALASLGFQALATDPRPYLFEPSRFNGTKSLLENQRKERTKRVPTYKKLISP